MNTLHHKEAFLIFNMQIPSSTPMRNLSVRANFRSIRLQELPGRIKMVIALPALATPRLYSGFFLTSHTFASHAANAQTTDISRSNCPKDELYAERV
jgi:hypothetical protein